MICFFKKTGGSLLFLQSCGCFLILNIGKSSILSMSVEDLLNLNIVILKTCGSSFLGRPVDGIRFLNVIWKVVYF